MLYAIEWQFGSWKSSLATYIARKVAIQTAKDIMKQRTFSWDIILSNIKMNKEVMPNYYYFEDDNFLEVLRTCNCINDLERLVYGKKNEKSWIINYFRPWFSRFFLFFDEVGAIMNNHIKLENNATYAEYINQNRKNFQDIYLITAKWSQTNKTLRQMVDRRYYVLPLSGLPFLRNIWVIRRQQKDENWEVLMEKFLWKDPNGDYITKYRPVDEYEDWFWKPWVWKLYEDLHKNIRDKYKYKNLDYNLLNNILENKRELIDPVLLDENFVWVKEKLLLINNTLQDELVLDQPLS